MNLPKSIIVFTGLASLAIVGACNYSPESSQGAAQGNLRLLATDDPFPYSSVTSAKITISKIEARTTDGAFTTLSGQVTTLDLVQLRNGVTSALVDAKVPSGNYDQLRLIVDSASVDLTDGRHFDLTVPSGSESGLKLDVEPAIDVTTQLSTDLVLDFDISRSFVARGNPNSAQGITGFNFVPVIRVANLTTAGSLGGVITGDAGTPADTSDDTPLSGALVTAAQNGTTVATSVTDSAGAYKLIGLPAGNYDVTVTAVGYSSRSATNLAVIAGNLLTENLLLAKSAGTSTP